MLSQPLLENLKITNVRFCCFVSSFDSSDYSNWCHHNVLLTLILKKPTIPSISHSSSTFFKLKIQYWFLHWTHSVFLLFLYLCYLCSLLPDKKDELANNKRFKFADYINGVTITNKRVHTMLNILNSRLIYNVNCHFPDIANLAQLAVAPKGWQIRLSMSPPSSEPELSLPVHSHPKNISLL